MKTTKGCGTCGGLVDGCPECAPGNRRRGSAEAVEADPRACFASGADARAFVLAGNAYLTLVSKKTGTRFTYRVAKKSGGTESDPFFVSVLSGPENGADYSYLGTIFPTRRVQVGGGSFGAVYGSVRAEIPAYVHGRKSRVSPTAPSARAFSWAWSFLGRGVLPETLEVWHEGRCGKCGRRLTVPSSIAAGIGPDCAETMAKAA